MPANLAMSKAWGAGAGAGAGASTLAPAPATPAAALSSTALSRAAANFCSCSPIMRPMRLYGDQKAWRTLIGASTTLTTLARQSRPWRS